MLADKYGRKWLLVLNIVQLQLRACFMYLVRKLIPRDYLLAYEKLEMPMCTRWLSILQ